MPCNVKTTSFMIRFVSVRYALKKMEVPGKAKRVTESFVEGGVW